jgi:hypothetical protein
MSTVLKTELYRLRTVRLWQLSLAGALVAAVAAAFMQADGWICVVAGATFGFGVVAGTQHYQHRTAVLMFLAQPRRWPLLAGQALTYAVAFTALAAVTGLPLLGRQPDDYVGTVVATPFLAVLAVALAAILRRPIWILAGAFGWFVVVEVLIGRLQLPGPFTGYLLAAAQKDLKMLVALVGWTVLAVGVAVRAIGRDLAGE